MMNMKISCIMNAKTKKSRGTGGMIDLATEFEEDSKRREENCNENVYAV